MSIINNAHAGSQYEVLTAIRNVLDSKPNKPMAETDLIAWCRPEHLASKESARKKVGFEITAWKDLGLLESSADGVMLNRQYFSDASIATSTAARRCLLVPDNNQDLDAREQRAADLTKLVCMLLSIDVYRERNSELRSNKLEEIVDAYLGDFRINSNEVAVVPGYLHWLGYAARIGNGMYAIDPTTAIKEELLAADNAIERDVQLPIESFLQQLAKRLPVIDGGAYRLHIEQRINEKNWSKPSNNDLSTSLSRALLRLHHAGVIKMQKLSDAGLRNLKGPNNRVLMPVTHVTVLGDK